ncbi:hypothetical protein jhhlp_001101 [Lomentospora prolificans]|uniref:Exonuclease domain-containing protein n=1 Tax=Lomentospora prolificans TaxID=41688 RepID=A0A2N3NHA4_9PEZI|nr:hypothetical protein jhhlp_001101 [Lomentospora prolificans]
MGKKTKERKKKAAKRRNHAKGAVAVAAAAASSPSSPANDSAAASPDTDRSLSVDVEPADANGTSTLGTTVAGINDVADRPLKRTTPHDFDTTLDPHSVEANAAAADDGDWETVHRNKKAKKMPKKDKKKYPSIDFSLNAKLYSKVRVADLRDLILYIFADGVAPKWVSVANRNQVRKIVTIMIPGIEESMFKPNVDFSKFDEFAAKQKPLVDDNGISSPDAFYPRVLNTENLHPAVKPFAEMFKRLWPIKTPGDDRLARMHSPMAAFLTAPLPKRAKDEKDTRTQVNLVREPPGFKDERTRITEFLTTPDELAENGYVLHPVLLATAEEKSSYTLPDGWVATKIDKVEDADVPESEIENGSVTAGRRVLGLDCEMVMTGENEFSLARISIVNWDGEVVLDKLVKPDKPVTNYVTQFSGITEAMLAPITTTLKDIQETLLDLLGPRTILVGHSLESDLKALRLTHPFIVDTSIIFPHPRGPPLKSSLKWLTQKYLGRQIQLGHGAAGHNSIEDAKACLDLTRQKCEKGKTWGEFEGGGENLFRRLARAGSSYNGQNQSSTDVGSFVRTSAAIDWGEPCKGPGGGATHTLACKSDEEVAQAVIRAVQGDPDGAEIRAGGVDFVWARMRELEAFRGWWNKNRQNSRGADVGPPEVDQLYIHDETTGASPLEACVYRLTQRLLRIYEALPPCTALILFSGSGDPREMSKMQALRTTWKQEYNTPGMKWDELSVKWTDTEEQALKRAVKKARDGVGFVTVK